VGFSLLTASASAAPSAQPDSSPLAVTISSVPYGQPMPPGFLGFSFEYKAMHQYAGRNPTAINPVLLSLVKQLNPGQSPIIRIGGDSTDYTWWPIPGEIAPGGVSYALTPGWLRTVRAFATDLNAKLILGINLEAGRPALAAQEARALVQGIGTNDIGALEIGNEPDIYPVVWYQSRNGVTYRGRPASYTMQDFIAEFSRFRAVMPAVPIAGPALAGATWMADLPAFLSAEPGLAYVTYHHYPLRACVADPSNPIFASIPNLLLDSSSAGLASTMAPFVQQAHGAGVKFRLDELNSASCRGRAGTSNTFASALWVLDTLFNLAATGVDGINLHTLPGAPYQPFTFSQSASGAWSGNVMPIYYGMLMFAQADPPGATLLNVGAPDGPLKIWATQDASGRIHVVLVNKDLTNAYTAQISLPGPTTPGSLETLSAPNFESTTGVQIGGQTFAPNTPTGQLTGTPQLQSVTPLFGQYNITVPAASAAMLTR
jgi:hypothetical protein